MEEGRARECVVTDVEGGDVGKEGELRDEGVRSRAFKADVVEDEGLGRKIWYSGKSRNDTRCDENGNADTRTFS